MPNRIRSPRVEASGRVYSETRKEGSVPSADGLAKRANPKSQRTLHLSELRGPVRALRLVSGPLKLTTMLLLVCVYSEQLT